MRIHRITISVPAAIATRIKKAAGVTPVSAWVTGVIEEHLEDEELERLWQDFCRSVHPKRRDIQRANAIFRRVTGASRRKRAA